MLRESAKILPRGLVEPSGMVMTMSPANGDGKHARVPDPGDEEGVFDAHSGLEDLGRWKEDHRRSYFFNSPRSFTQILN
jgi:hypothetical protein